ncbi:MAG TPA: CAP domain-containing protein [Phototrophicaceae bacterium]|nr:CAP domain-containing protein [Phototrophicaceae bacterium]
MTPARSHRAIRSVQAVTASLRHLLRTRDCVAPPLQRRYRIALSGGLAVALVAGVSAAAVVQDEPMSARADLAALGLEAAPAPTTPGITVPEGEEVAVPVLDVDVELGKSDVWHLRDAQVASRNAERQAIEERRAAEAAAQQQASRQAAPREQVEQPAAASSAPAPAPVQAAQGGERGSLAAMVNNLRAQNGLAALGRHDSLDSTAQGWAEWMAANQVLQHNPNYRSQIGGGWSRSGENIVRNTGAQAWSSGDITAWMFNWWANSAVHRANMLGAEYTHVGVGYAMGAGGPYAVLVFGG